MRATQGHTDGLPDDEVSLRSVHPRISTAIRPQVLELGVPRALPLAGPGRRPGLCFSCSRRTRSEVFHSFHARQDFEGLGEAGGDVEGAGEGDFDVLFVFEAGDEDDAAAALAFAGEEGSDVGDGFGLLEPDAHAAAGAFGCGVQRLDVGCGDAQGFAFELEVGGDDDGGSDDEEVAGAAEGFAEEGDFVAAAGVGQADPGHAAAGAGDAFLDVDHRAGELDAG